MDSFNMSMRSLATAKICRLCETKDGPFLNIFGPDMDLAKKIENVVFITINEYDDLPHKICFRCSARLEDFQEFLNKCIKAQENLSNSIGKRFAQKNPQTRKIKYSWEAKLNENKISNEQYCDELIKKALELATDFTTKSRESDKKWMKKFNVRNSEIRLWSVDRHGFPGIEKRNGKYRVVDIRKVPKIVPKTNKQTSRQVFGNSNTNNSNKTDINKLASNTKIILKPVNQPSGLKQANQPSLLKPVNQSSQTTPSQNTSKQVIESNNATNQSIKSPQTKTLPDNFTTVRVAGVGTVYTCKNCDSVILEVQKAYNHKCYNLKNPKTTTPVSASQRPRISTNDTTSKLNKPGPARHKQAAESVYKEVDQDHIVDLDEVPDSPPPTKKMFNMPNPQAPNVMANNVTNNPNFYGYQFPTNFYLVPSGNNTFALQAGPPANAITPSALSNVHSQIKAKLNQQPAVQQTPPVVSFQTPQESNSILPDINRPPVYSADRNAPVKGNSKASKRSKKQKESEVDDNYVPPKKVVVTQSAQKKNKAVETAAPAPYPIGLLCRNSNSANVEDFKTKPSLSSSQSTEYPQYTILPPKTPGKIVISTVPQKKTPTTDVTTQAQETRPPKKRKKQVIEVMKDFEEEEAPPPPEPNQHFFTYINLDSMLGPPAVLSTETVQESSVSTTVAPKSNESVRKPPRIISVAPKQKQPELRDVYTCSICDLTFSREKKLVAHVRTHYESNYDDD